MNRPVEAHELIEWIKEYRAAITTGKRKIKMDGKWYGLKKAKHSIQFIWRTQHPLLDQLELDLY